MSNPYLDKLLSLEPDWVLGYTFRDSGNDRVWDDDSGSAGDYDVVLNDGTERTEGGPTNDTDARWVYFDGTASNWGAAAEGITGLTDYTMSAWVRVPETDVGWSAIFASYNFTDGNYRSWYLEFRGAETTHSINPETYGVAWSEDGSSLTGTYGDTGIPERDTWDHITVTRSGSTITFYRNGVSVATLTEGTQYLDTPHAFFTVAKTHDTATRFPGDIHTPALWTSALSAQDVSDLYDAASEEPVALIEKDYNTELTVVDPHPINDAVALWRFEEGELTTDSTGNGNTLLESGSPTADTIEFREGAASVEFTSATSDLFEIWTGGQSANFPFKAGTTDDTGSFAFWVKFNHIPAEGFQGIFAKWRTTDDERSIILGLRHGVVRYSIGTDGGESFEVLDEFLEPLEGRWYHMLVTFDNGDWSFRVWDDTAQMIVFESSGTATGTMYLGNRPFILGQWPISGYSDLNLDQFAVWNRVVTYEEQNYIAGIPTYSIDKNYKTELTVGTSTIDRTYKTELNVNIMTFAWDFDAANIHPANSSITNADTATPTMVIAPRVVGTRTNGTNLVRWNHFYFRLDGAEGKTPTFSVDFSDHISAYQTSPRSTWRPWYSYDGINWTRSTVAWSGSAGGVVTFDFGTPFTENTVYVSYTTAYPVWRVRHFLDHLTENHGSFVHELPSSTTLGNHILGMVDSQTDDLGRVLPAIEMLSYGIWDDLGAETRKIAIWTAGIHASEQMSNHLFEHAVLWLLSNDPKAEWLRQNFKFYCYPMNNPQGRFGGHRRGQWDPADLTKDMNRDWNDLTLQATNLIHDAILTDVPGAVDISHDFHDMSFLQGDTSGESLMFYGYTTNALTTAWRDAIAAYGTYTYVDSPQTETTSGWMADTKNVPVVHASECLVQTEHDYAERFIIGEYIIEATYDAYYEGEIDRSYKTELTVQGHDMSPISIETGAALLGQPSLEGVEPGIVDLLAASVETGIPILGTPTLTTPTIGRRYRVYKRVS